VLYLLLKVASAVGMGLVLKQADARRIDRLPVIRVNYAVAAVIAFAGALLTRQSYISMPTAVLAALTGVVFVAGLLVWAKAIETAGLALSVVAMRTAIVIPTLVSMVGWRERPAPFQLAGIVVALIALGLVLWDTVSATKSEVRSSKSEVPGPDPSPQSLTPNPSPRAAPLWLAGLFLVDGIVMVPARVFRQYMPQEETFPFQAVIFIAAFFVTTLLYYLRKPRMTQQSVNYGAALGAANLGNYLFLVLALAVLPGIVVYPAIAAGEVGLMALAGVLIWKEKVGARSWVGIACAILSLVLIQLGRAP
jgi:drug/metabolite transporter (DMT)-like permease